MAVTLRRMVLAAIVVVCPLSACGGGDQSAAYVARECDGAVNLLGEQGLINSKVAKGAATDSLRYCKSRAEWLDAATVATWNYGILSREDALKHICKGRTAPACK